MRKTKSKLVRFGAVVVSIIMLSGCAASKGENKDSSEAAGETREQTVDDTADESNKDASGVKVGLILEGSRGDDSINDQAYNGLMEVEKELGCEVNFLEVTDTAAYADSIENLCDAGYQIVCCDSFAHADALAEVAPKYPDVSFMILDTVVEGDNVTSFGYKTQECAFLAGVAAAMASESDTIGFIGGMEIPTIQRYQYGFEDGVHYVNPDAEVIAKYIGNDANAWSDPATAKSLTLDMIAKGADVCFHAAGGSGAGMIQACDENGIYAIGVNVDQSMQAPEHVLTSALTNGDRAIYMFVESYLNGEVLKGEQILDCSNDGVGIVESKLMSEEMIDKVNECKDLIVKGEIEIRDALAQ